MIEVSEDIELPFCQGHGGAEEEEKGGEGHNNLSSIIWSRNPPTILPDSGLW
jgi:hypothetical protein